jgi:hypothetical protein
MTVRIVSWNTCQGLRPPNQEALRRLAPDLAVVCESSQQNPWASTPDGDPVCWDSDGEWVDRYVAVAGFGANFRPRSNLRRAGRHCAGLEGPGVGLLGIWSVKQTRGSYADEVLRILEANADWIARGDVVVAGDLNIDAHGVGDSPSAGARRFRRVIDTVTELGLVSAYHAHTGEPFGQETCPTYYHQRNPTRPYHIDYCFIPAAWVGRLERAEVGAAATWKPLSDHMPLIVDLTDTQHIAPEGRGRPAVREPGAAPGGAAPTGSGPVCAPTPSYVA